MLNTIKSAITGKEELLESVQVIYEDAIDDIENYIAGEDDNIHDEDEIPVVDTSNNNVADVIEDNDDDADDSNDEDIMKMDINDPDALTQTSSIFDMKLNDAETQEDDNSDIFNMSIDIKTNTLTDILPIPPMNAGDAVADNIMNTNIDDGFNEAAALSYSDGELGKLVHDNYKGNRSDIGAVKDKLADGEKLTAREAAIFRIHYPSKHDGKHENVGYILMQNYKGNKIPSKTLDAFTESFNEFYDFTEAAETMEVMLSESTEDVMKNVVEIRNGLKEIDNQIPGVKKPMRELLALVKRINAMNGFDVSKKAPVAFKKLELSFAKIYFFSDRKKNKDLTPDKIVEGLAAEVEKIKSYVSEMEALKGKPITEAISIDASADDQPTDTTEPTAGDTSATEPNAVTDAVIDKVKDAEATPASTSDPEDFKTKIMDKLDKLNKGIVDMKENIKKHIS